jgi:RimJ/RimL family protein N-acetyltransferase
MVLISLYDSQKENAHHETWAAECEGKVIGHVDLKASAFTNEGELEVTGLLLKEYWRTGLATEVFPALAQHVKRLHKTLVATVSPDNLPSVNLIEALGGELPDANVMFEGRTFLKFRLTR